MSDPTKNPTPAGAAPTPATPPPAPTGNFAPAGAAAPAPAVGTPDAKAQAEAQRKLVEKMHGPNGYTADQALRTHAASTSTLLTTDAHVGKRTGEPHKDQAMEDLKVGAATRTTDHTAPVKTVPIATGTPPDGKPTDEAVLARENQGLVPATIGTVGHGADAVGITTAIAEATGKGPGEPGEVVEGAKPSAAAADPAHAGQVDAELKGKPPEGAKPAGDK